MSIQKISLMILVCLGFCPTVYPFDYWQALPAAPESPEDNQPTKKKLSLGRQLFFDTRLSRSARTACMNCHNVFSSGADGKAQSLGDNGKFTRRSTPSLWNVAYQTVYFWDGRAKSLEEAIQNHLVDPEIMGFNNENALNDRLKRIESYRNAFLQHFGSVTAINISKALAVYIRSLITPNSAFDRYIRGDKRALSADQLKGMELFRESECLACHFGVNFSGPAPGPALKMGDGFYELFPIFRVKMIVRKLGLKQDKGRFHITRESGHVRMWRVPSLRNIALTAPYFHNGSANNLRDAVKWMAAGQRDMDLSEEQIDLIVKFLNSLTGERPKLEAPVLPPTPNHTVSQ